MRVNVRNTASIELRSIQKRTKIRHSVRECVLRFLNLDFVQTNDTILLHTYIETNLQEKRNGIDVLLHVIDVLITMVLLSLCSKCFWSVCHRKSLPGQARETQPLPSTRAYVHHRYYIGTRLADK